MSDSQANFESPIQEGLRSEFRSLPHREILNRSPRVLLGVSPEAEAILASLEISTVFDLATSGLFSDATKIVSAARDPRDPGYQHGTPTADIVREELVAGVALPELQGLPLGALQRVPMDVAERLQLVLDVVTIRELSLYPPYLAAVRLMNEAYFPDNAAEFDPERPADLVPKSGEFPTEKVQYTTLLLDEIPLDDGVRIVDVSSSGFKPIDLAQLASADSGFKKTAFGALLTFNQSWYAQGVTLGQLLHSTSLAPGESTRIAVVDWSRKSRAGETEVIDETDDLSNDQTQNRSIGEVTQAVAKEAQGGFSSANTNSHSTQSGTSSAMELSAPFGGFFGGPSGSMGETSSDATERSHSDSYSSSWGQRNIGSSMSQQVNDRTHQHAHSNRSRRASVVKEVSQSEHESVSTRVIANYNHMHALTVQYYEVVQIYRVEVGIVRADRVVFLPFRLVDFDDAAIHRFRGVLSRAALTYGIRQALQNLDTLELELDQKAVFSTLGDRISVFAKASLADRLKVVKSATGLAQTKSDGTEIDATQSAPTAPRMVKKGFSSVAAMSVVQQVNQLLWKVDQASRLAGLLNLNVLRPTRSSLFLPTDISVEGAAVDAEGANVHAVFHLSDGRTISVIDADSPVPLSQIKRIGLVGSSPERSIVAEAVLTVNRNGVRFPVELPQVTIAKGATAETRLVAIKAAGADVNLKQHLRDNQMHYSQAVFRSLDAAQTAFLLSGYGVNVAGKTVPVAQVVDPKPIRIVGNYLAFKMNSDPQGDPAWAAWLKERGIHLGPASEEIIPLATGGTFAEAVLGRSNCAEKLDITRFWNWQDSPIPLQPTEIAAVQTGSRATSEDVKPGQLSNPIINITSPASLPDPMGTAAILSAIQNGNMFRDMSGLQATVGLAQAALQASAAGAATAGEQAGTNMNNLLKANTERQRIAAEMITSLAKTAASAYTGGAIGAGGGISAGSHSQDGAKINYFDKTKSTATPTSTGSSTTSSSGGSAPISGGSSSGGGVVSTGGGSGAVQSAGSIAPKYSQNPAALAATWGDSQSKSDALDALISRAANLFGSDQTPSPEAGQPTTNKFWPYLDGPTVLARNSELAKDANKIKQGRFGLCTAASFYHHVIQRDSAKFLSFANALYGAGVGYLGNFKIEPGGDLRHTKYAEQVAKYPDTPPMADWMLMTSIRDSENIWLDFTGSDGDVNISIENIFSLKAITTEFTELVGWYQKTGLYSSVERVDKPSPDRIKSLSKTSTNHINFFIDSSLIKPEAKNSTHMITLETQMVIDEAADTVNFTYWTWGWPLQNFSGKWSDLKSKLLGVIIATF